MLTILVGATVCFGSYFAGRALVRRLLALPGVSPLSRRAEPGYFRAPLARRLAWRMAGPAAAYLVCVGLAFFAARAGGQSVQTTVVDVVSGGRAAAAGVRSGD